MICISATQSGVRR